MSSYAEKVREQVRAAALDAVAEAVVARDGSVSTAAFSMAEVATRAGVSRQTLYNEFGSRDGLLTALADRENALLLARVLQELDTHGDDIVGAVSAAAEVAVRMAADNVLHKALLTGETSTVGLLVAHGESLLLRSQSELSTFMLARFPALDPADTALLVGVVTRFVQSHLLLPYEPADVVAAQVHRLVERYLAGGPDGPGRTLVRVDPDPEMINPVHRGGPS